MKTVQDRQITFHMRGREPISGRSKNPEATLGSIAGKAARKLGLNSGTFQCLDRNNNNKVLAHDTRLADLPENITVAPELTPA